MMFWLGSKFDILKESEDKFDEYCAHLTHSTTIKAVKVVHIAHFMKLRSLTFYYRINDHDTASVHFPISSPSTTHKVQ